MSIRDRTDSNTEEGPRNPVTPNDQIEKLKMRKDMLWGLFEEHRAYARHTETLRATVINMLIIASAGLVTLATYDKKLNSWDVPAALLLVGFGLLGPMFSLYHTEKIWRHKTRASEYRNTLDTTVLDSPEGADLEGGEPRDEGGELRDIRMKADKNFREYIKGKVAGNPTLRVVEGLDKMGIPGSLILWSVLPMFISMIGLLLLVAMLLQ